MDILQQLYDTVLERKDEKQEGSYTCYLFEQGLDKILKKCGEECSEVIIAAKNGKKEDTVGEISDLLYHLTVMMVNENIPLDDVRAELNRRHGKTGNLKTFHKVDHNTGHKLKNTHFGRRKSKAPKCTAGIFRTSAGV